MESLILCRSCYCSLFALTTVRLEHYLRGTMERVMGIEPTSSAWEAEVLPLNYTRDAITLKSITDACPRTDSIDQVINA